MQDEQKSKNGKAVSIVFPHQLFEDNPCIDKNRKIIILEEYLFFKQYNFHRQKIKYHRSTMKFYERSLISKGHEINYISAIEKVSDIRLLIPSLKSEGVEEIHFCDPVDDWLNSRITEKCKSNNITCVEYESPMFINNREDIQVYFKDKKRLFQTDFYIHQRKARNILLDENKNPIGGKWTFDAENRKKYPAKKTPPNVLQLVPNDFDKEALLYVQTHFGNNYGSTSVKYPSTYHEAQLWLDDFFINRFAEFGEYEDALVESENILHHSVLTPMLNIGLLLPMDVISRAISFASKNDIPINSLEGFVRQIVGWREFIRAVYILKGKEERTKNFWEFKRKMPKSFYNASTGIIPADNAIIKVLNTAYNHHIERLMVLGNIMVLSEIHPDEVYKWFMEMYIDAYDWVMVPNVYGMSQFADGGIMATKPYISGSNYLMKMSNFSKGKWQESWDSLFWNFMDKHRNFFLKNPRLGMLIKTFDKMDIEKKTKHLTNAEEYFKKLDIHVF